MINVFQRASEILGDVQLSSFQLAELRAIDHACQQALLRITRNEDSSTRTPTAAELADVETMCEKRIRGLIAP